MNILHIASFNGNIGDIANHKGFQRNISKIFDVTSFTNLEMRNFYRSRGGRFDENFAEFARDYDLIVFGGGAFWELKWDYSTTGNTIDITPEIINKIGKPILFNCLGTGPKSAYTANAISSFGSWLGRVTQMDNVFLSVRNDGSYNSINNLYNDRFRNFIMEIPDGGFYCDIPDVECAEIVKGAINIAVNLGDDLPEERFPGNNGYLSREDFLSSFSAMLNELMYSNDKIRLIFIPHIYSDLNIISKCLAKIKDEYCRTRVTVSSCLNGELTDGLRVFSVYKQCDLVLGMRYHANIVPIGLNTPTLMLGTLDDQICLYSNLGIENRCVPVNKPQFEIGLKEKICNYLYSDKRIENTGILAKINACNNVYMQKIKQWYFNQNRI